MEMVTEAEALSDSRGLLGITHQRIKVDVSVSHLLRPYPRVDDTPPLLLVRTQITTSPHRRDRGEVDFLVGSVALLYHRAVLHDEVVSSRHPVAACPEVIDTFKDDYIGDAMLL